MNDDEKIFSKHKEEVLDNLEALKVNLQQCEDIGMEDIDDTVYNQILDLEDDVKMADSKIEITKGLSDRDFLDESSGMYFVLGEREVVNFWMKGMRFPIDIIWIDSGKITGLTKNASVPQNGKIPTYTSPTAITNVLEVNAGFADKYNIKIDDKVEIVD